MPFYIRTQVLFLIRACTMMEVLFATREEDLFLYPRKTDCLKQDVRGPIITLIRGDIPALRFAAQKAKKPQKTTRNNTLQTDHRSDAQ